MKLEKTLETGMKGDYWKIIQTRTDYISGKTKAVLGLYKDAEQRHLNSNGHFHTAVFAMTGPDLTRADIYAKMKESQKDSEGHEMNEWALALDIIEP